MTVKKRILLLFLFGLFFSVQAQVSKDYAVLLTANVFTSPAKITLVWNSTTGVSSQLIYRKAKNSLVWNAPTTLPSTDTTYNDLTVIEGIPYEYYVRRVASGRTAHGYILSGINIAEIQNRGKMLLLVDANYQTPLSTEITELEKDLVGDGWIVKTLYINRTENVKNVKSKITSELAAFSGNKAIYLLGHIPVPYSGYINPDAHPDHLGAWPADVYYAVFNESVWTDTDVNDSTSASRAANKNVIGDGKFDLSALNDFSSLSADAQIGRVDLTNLTSFTKNDEQLTKQYLQKAHRFKTRQIVAKNQALIHDNFGAFSGEAFAASAWRNFSTMVGNQIYSTDYISSVKQDSYLWSYGCGGGSYSSCSGIGTSASFNNDSINTVFTILFGSYFGDWDSPNNFLRAPLASMPMTLASMWSGRPHLYVHPMGLGENIGYTSLLNMNNQYSFGGTNRLGYWPSNYPTFVSIALMGDPSLRAHTIIPASNIALQKPTSNSVKIDWTASTDNSVTGYNIYFSTSLNDGFNFLAKVSSSTTTFTDLNLLDAHYYFMVRAIKPEISFSGTYTNQSIGIFDKITVGNPAAINDVEVNDEKILVYPNPAKDFVSIVIENGLFENASVELLDIFGKLVYQTAISESSIQTIPINGLNDGVYLLKINSGKRSAIKKLMVSN